MLLTELNSLADERQLEAIKSRWLEIACSTAPADHQAAETALLQAYKSAGLPAPAVVVWLGSPRAADTAVRILRSNIEWPSDLSDFQRGVWETVWKQSVRQIEQHMGEARWSSIRKSIKDEATKTIIDKYGHYYESQAKQIFGEKLGVAAWRYLREIAGAHRDERIRTDVEQAVKNSASQQATHQLSEKIFQTIVPSIRQQVWAPIVEPLRLAIGSNNGVLASDGVARFNCGNGLHDADWLAYYDVLKQLGVKGTEPLDGIKKLAQSCGWWWPLESICFLSERPRVVHRDNRGRLHNDKGPAIEYPDGWCLYSWNGILVPPEVILATEITFEQIESESNTTIRRVLIERFGLDNYLRAGKCVKVHQDECGTLYRMNLPGDEPILVVQVINSTPEPDGTYNEYFLRVPPNMSRARQAVAWTFGMTEDEYYPLAET